MFIRYLFVYFLFLLACIHFQWSHSLEKINSGSIYNIAWSSDSTQVAMACSNGTVLTGHIIDRYKKKHRSKILHDIQAHIYTLAYFI